MGAELEHQGWGLPRNGGLARPGTGEQEKGLCICLYCSLWASGGVHTHTHASTLATLVQLPRASCKHRTFPRSAHQAPTRPDPSPKPGP